MIVSVLLAAAVATAAPPATPADAFFANLTALCGQRFEGRLVSEEAADSAFAGQRLVMHVRDCSDSEIRIPFTVGADRSRTWIVTRTGEGVRLKHDHRHADGSADVRTDYGGDSAPGGTAERQSFPADAFSRDLFVREAIPQAVENVWSLEVRPGALFAYELARPNRFFRVEFDLTRPAAE